MNSRRQSIFPKYNSLLDKVGENIKLARKRRKLTTIQVAERADIARYPTVRIEDQFLESMENYWALGEIKRSLKTPDIYKSIESAALKLTDSGVL